MRLRPRTLRGRLTLVFALVTLALSLLVGVLVDIEYRSALRSALDEGLTTRFAAAAEQVLHAARGSNVQPAIPDAESFAQVIDATGKVVAGSPRSLRHRRVLDAGDLRRARLHRVTLVHDAGPRGERSRLLAGPVTGTGDVAVVGTTLEETTRAQHRLELALGIGLPLLALLVTVAGWFLAGAALSPVQEMIEDADVISARSARHLSRRLTVPEGAGEELAELARTLNHMLERIEQALEHERMFLDDASHELRTPISIARGEIELARMQAVEGTDTAAALDSAFEEVERLDHLAVSLLVLGRMRAAGPPPETPVDLADVARQAVGTATAAASAARPRVAVRVEGHAATRGDEEAIQRAIRNVVENALRYARSEVIVSLENDAEGAVVEVVDDGPGFPDYLLANGVSRFGPGDNPQAHGGAGLGLAIVDAIVSAHGGKVELVARHGAPGAIVRLRLPAPELEPAGGRR
jgi:two-component system OmpR family sensor kinase